MMRFPNEETVKRVREQYPAGTRIELVRMDDVQAPPEGTHGTVVGVDDTASLLVNWDNGSGLNVVYGEDIVKKLKTVKTVCYGEEKIWDSREESSFTELRTSAGLHTIPKNSLKQEPKY